MVLEAKKAEVREERESRREPLTDSEARELLRSVSEVVIARGPSMRRLKSSEAGLDDLRGPTGSFRAPMIRKGRTLLVGFNDEELKKLLS